MSSPGLEIEKWDNRISITPTRSTHVIFDSPRKELLEPGFVIHRNASQASRKQAFQRQNDRVVLIDEKTGWVVRNYWDAVSLTVENKSEDSDAVANAFLGAAAGAMASNFEEVKQWKKPKETLQPGVTFGSAFTLRAQGAPAIKKKVSASSSWISTLAALRNQENTFIGWLTQKAPTIPMDIVYRTSLNDDPERDLLFIFKITQNLSDSPDRVFSVVFNGPSLGKQHYVDNTAGTILVYNGIYKLVVYGNGRATLHAYAYNPLEEQNQWFFVSEIVLDPIDRTNGVYAIKILKVNASKKEGYSGSLNFDSYHARTSLSAKTFDWQATRNESFASKNSNYVSIPIPLGVDGEKGTVQETMIEVSMRRDVMGSFSLYRSAKPSKAYLVDDILAFPWYPGVVPVIPGEGAIYAYWEGVCPEGTSMEIFLYDAETHNELTLLDTIGSNGKIYAPNYRRNAVYAKVKFNTDTKVSPRLLGITIARYPIIRVSESVEKENYSLKLTGINIVGAERDMSHSTATIYAIDFATDGENDYLRSKSSIPVRIEIETDPDDSSKRCILFEGYTSRVTAKRKTRIDPNYIPTMASTTETIPEKEREEAFGGEQGVEEHDIEHVKSQERLPGTAYYELEIKCVSMYQKLRENVNIYNRPLIEADGTPFKITDIIKGLLNQAGFANGQIGIQDLPVRAYTLTGGPMANLEVLADIGKTIQDLQTKYLPYSLVWEPNIGPEGKWIFISPARPPYNNRAAFVFDPEDLNPKPAVPYIPIAYTTYSQEAIPTTFVKKGSLSSWVKPPETNLVIVSAFGKTTPTGVPEHLFQVIPNFKSFDFGNGLVDPNHPDYLGRLVPMYVMVPEIQWITQHLEGTTTLYNPAVSWLARRIFDIAAHAIKFISFEAPLLLIEDQFENQVYKRPLRYYDPVLVNGEQFLIRNVNPTYKKDHLQWAVYECEAPRI